MNDADFVEFEGAKVAVDAEGCRVFLRVFDRAPVLARWRAMTLDNEDEINGALQNFRAAGRLGAVGALKFAAARIKAAQARPRK